MSNLVKKLENVFDKNRILDEFDIKEIIYSYVKQNGLEAWVRDICFIDNAVNGSLACYNYDKLVIILAKNNIYENARCGYNIVRKRVNISFNHYLNFSLLTIVFHELKHAEQYKELFLANGEENSLVLNLYSLNDSLTNERKSNGLKLYERHYELFPCEREADIYALNEALSGFQSLDKKLITRDELKFYQMYFVNNLLKDYQRKLFKVVSPIQTLLTIADGSVKKQYNMMINEEYLSLYRRFVLGLPVTLDEYNRVRNISSEIENNELLPRENIKNLILKRG